MNSNSDRTLPSSGKLHRKDRERLTKRKEIIEAARIVFARHGFDNSTLDEIAVQAEFAKGTIYNYFESKEALLIEIIDNMLCDVIELAHKAGEAGDSAADCFEQFAVAAMRYYKANNDLLQILIAEMGRIHSRERITHIMQRLDAIAVHLAGYLRCAAEKKGIALEDPLDLAYAFYGMIHNRMIRRLLQASGLAKLEIEAEARSLTQLFFCGVARVPL